MRSLPSPARSNRFEIQLCRASQLHPFIVLLQDLGVDVDDYLRRALISQRVLDEPDLIVAMHPIRNLIKLIDDELDQADFGSTAAGRYGALAIGPALLVAASTSKNLGEYLYSFCTLQDRLVSMPPIWLVEGGSGTFLCRKNAQQARSGKTTMQQYMVALMVEIVRYVAGEPWSPPQVWIEEEADEDVLDYVGLKTPVVLLRREETRLLIPKRVLSHRIGLTRTGQPPLPAPIRPSTPVESLILALTPYLDDGMPTLQHAALILGISARTIQRLLARHNTTYRDVVQQLRRDLARQLLQQQSLVADVSNCLDYATPAQFSRAFRRWEGCSPREFRSKFSSA